MIYFILFILLFFLSLSEFLDLNFKFKNQLFLICLLILFLFTGLRYETGGDWFNYTHNFSLIEPINKILIGHNDQFNLIKYEFLFKVLCSITKSVIDNFQFFLIVVQIILTFLLYKSLKEYSIFPIISLVIYYSRCTLIFDFVVIRQSIAILIIFYSLKYFESKNYYKFIILILFASLFHASALIVLFVSFFLRKHFSNVSLILYFILVNFIFIFKINWIYFIVNYLIHLDINSYITSKLIFYSTNNLESHPKVFSLAIIVNLIIFCLLLYFRTKLMKFRYFNLFFNYFLVYIFFSYLFYEFSMLSKRLEYYFFISIVIIIPMIINVFNYKLNKIIAYFIFAIYLVLASSNIYFEKPSSIAYNPYQNFLVYKLFNKKSTGFERFFKSRTIEEERILKSKREKS